MIKVQFDLPTSIDVEVKWVWEIFCHHFKIEYSEINESPVDLLISNQHGADVQVSDRFIQLMETEEYSWKNWFKDQTVLVGENEAPDLLGTAFYMLNSLQEYGTEEQDEFGRFKWEASYQCHFGVTENNLVGDLFEELKQLLKEKIKFPDPISSKTRNSALFVSHDVDHLTSGLLEDGFWCLKKGMLLKMSELVFRHFSNDSHWNNIEEVENITKDHGYHSTFFWIPVKGKCNLGIKNADYILNSKAIQGHLKRIQASANENGLHKSSLDHSMNDEMQKFPFEITSNRNHYLKIILPEHYHRVEASGLKVDCSLGFAEKIGFRNSYCRPFFPFNLKARKPFSFLEVPLNVMDITLSNYMSLSPEEAFKLVDQFLGKHKTDSIISLLFHNNLITPFKFGKWAETFKKILKSAEEKKFRSVTPSMLWKEHQKP